MLSGKVYCCTFISQCLFEGPISMIPLLLKGFQGQVYIFRKYHKPLEIWDITEMLVLHQEMR